MTWLMSGMTYKWWFHSLRYRFFYIPLIAGDAELFDHIETDSSRFQHNLASNIVKGGPMATSMWYLSSVMVFLDVGVTLPVQERTIGLITGKVVWLWRIRISTDTRCIIKAFARWQANVPSSQIWPDVAAINPMCRPFEIRQWVLDERGPIGPSCRRYPLT